MGLRMKVSEKFTAYPLYPDSPLAPLPAATAAAQSSADAASSGQTGTIISAGETYAGSHKQAAVAPPTPTTASSQPRTGLAP